MIPKQDSERRRGSARLGLVVAATSVLLGLLASAIASAAISSSSWARYMGPITIGGSTRCASQQAQVAQPHDTAGRNYIGRNQAFANAGCASTHGRPPGHLGILVYLMQQGTVCNYVGWYYNTTTTNLANIGGDFTPSSYCQSGIAKNTQTISRYWNTNTSSYIQAGFWTVSPSLNVY